MAETVKIRREIQSISVLELLATGHNNRTIARKLKMPESTLYDLMASAEFKIAAAEFSKQAFDNLRQTHLAASVEALRFLTSVLNSKKHSFDSRLRAAQSILKSMSLTVE